ncbi:MAG: type I methionyl aminopeptidase [Proteobacteria bacterium]|nr:type I methionyl aminopeptidase [Pseudomonadota bacterium]
MALAERIAIKTRREIDAMRAAGRAVAETLLALREHVEPGLETSELDRLARCCISKHGAKSSFLDYGPGGLPPYPAVVCVSVNEEIVHGIPGSRKLSAGDVVSIDFGLEIGGFHGDSAFSMIVGEKENPEAARLIEVTRESLYKGLEQMVPGKRLSDIGHAVQMHVEDAGYSVVKQFVGHGIGRQMHEPPQIPNYGRPGRGRRLLPGMVFAIEPMVNVGSDGVRMLDDEWTAVTEDGQLSAHFEHTVLITDNGPEVMTKVAGSH